MKSNDEKPFRTAPRRRTALQVRLSGAAAGLDEDLMAETVDLSATGAFVRCDTAFEPGTRLSLEIEHPDNEPPITVEAEVKWCAPDGAEERGIGVHFLNLPATIRRQLARMQSQGELPVLEIYGEDPD